MPSHPDRSEADPLGLDQDIEGRSGPLLDWKLIARLNLPYAQIVKRFGVPPKAARQFFVKGVKTKGFCVTPKAGGGWTIHKAEGGSSKVVKTTGVRSRRLQHSG
jgi:hypothetical protein